MYEPEYEKYLNDKQSYADYLMAVLKRWQQTNGNNATLETLVNALKNSQNKDVAKSLENLYQNHLCKDGVK